jgi:hypothetical protein
LPTSLTNVKKNKNKKKDKNYVGATPVDQDSTMEV